MANKCKQDTLFIMAGKGYDYHGLVQSGYSVIQPYRDRNIFERVLREICFKLKLQKPWYSKAFLKYDYKCIVVRDPLITAEYLSWLKANNPGVRLVFTYGNLVGRAKHIMPYDIPDGYKAWTYDAHDSEKYHIALAESKVYFECYVHPKKQSKYDVLFVGRDKGRLDYLLELKNRLENLGLRTKFLITADGRLSKKDKRYGKPVPYTQIAEWIAESKAILNVALPGQYGITVRDMESVFNKVKLITTNTHIVDSEIYDADNVFLLSGFQVDGIADFINKPYHEHENDTEKFSLEKYIREITGASEDE